MASPVRNSCRLLLALTLFFAPVVGYAACSIDDTPCSGCGCKGGPGYRHIASGRCVGFKDLAKKCGHPPGPDCVFENAPGTGANRECALEPRAPKKKPVE